jgi:hypothetical protein
MLFSSVYGMGSLFHRLRSGVMTAQGIVTKVEVDHVSKLSTIAFTFPAQTKPGVRQINAIDTTTTP